MQNCLKKYSLLLFICFIPFEITFAQNKPQLTETSVVKDTLGNIVPFTLWSKLLPSGRYEVKPEKTKNDEFIFIISRLTDDEYERRLSNSQMPEKSKYFNTGSNFRHFRTKDIEGNKIDTKDLLGKTLVLNFWFINCPPCQMEIPELDKLAASYKNDSSVVFIAIALDQKSELKEFLKIHSFGYNIVDDGRIIANQYRINSYPTNVIVDPEGKVYFHTSGLASNTVYWLKKSIEAQKKISLKTE